MALTRTYISETEAGYAFSNFSEYTADQKSWALQESYLLVNSWLRPEITIPPVEIWDGIEDVVIAPSVLKLAQAQFVKYLLMQRNMNFDESVQGIYDATVQMLKEVQQGDLAIETQVSSSVVGSYIVDTSSPLSGTMVVSPEWYGSESDRYIVEIDSVGDLYPYSVYNTSSYCTYKWRTQSSDWIDETQTCKTDWTQIGNCLIRFTGILSEGDTWTIQGTPASDQNLATESPVFHQANISY